MLVASRLAHKMSLIFLRGIVLSVLDGMFKARPSLVHCYDDLIPICDIILNINCCILHSR